MEEYFKKGNNFFMEIEKFGNGVGEEVICMKREDLQNLMMDSQNRVIKCCIRELYVYDRICFKCGNLRYFVQFCL